MARVYQFQCRPGSAASRSARDIRNDLPDWQGAGMSVMEISHRSKPISSPWRPRAEADLRELLLASR